MKINTLLQAWMIVVVSVLLAHAGFAQAPNGSISSQPFRGFRESMISRVSSPIFLWTLPPAMARQCRSIKTSVWSSP